MSHLNSGLLLAYNSLTDKHLTGYFSNTRIRRHLLRAGLITRSGRIVPDKEYRHRLLQRAHQKHVRECLAQAIFHKVLEMERLHRTEIKKKLEEFTRRERVHKIKVQHSKRCEEDVARVLSPHPPTGARGRRKNDSGPEGERSESSLSPSSSRPNTAPGKMQRPVRLKPIHSSSTTASVRRNSPYRLHEFSHASSQPLNRTMNKESCRASGPKETSFDISPCYLPVINNFVTPIPPVTRRKDRSSEISPSIRGRRLRNATAFSGAEDLPWLRSSIHQSQVCMNMVYFGKTVHLSHDLLDLRDEVKVFQQHCGGENLCVYKGMLREGETFQFLSRRHRGFPFSLTFFLNGLQVERLSACCEFKYRKGSRLGGKHGNFGFLGVEGAAPCYKCIIALGLDKMPTPPPKRLKEGKGPEELITSPKDSAEADGGNAAFPSESSRAQNTENQDQTFLEEDKTREDYEEDFEADDEAAAEEAKEDLSPSLSSQTETQGKENEAPETEDEKDEDIKSDSDSSFLDSDQEESDVEAKNDIKEEENREPIEEHEEKAVTPEEEEEQNPEETAEEEAAAVNSAADSTEVEISDPRGPSGNEMKLSEETPEEEKMAEERHSEEEQDRAKSVQEKLAEAILKQSQCSSEPELSDTSTEEEEEHRDEGSEQASKEEDPKEEMVTEETKCDEGGSAEVSEEQKETPKIEENEEPHDDTKEEETCEAEEGEKGAEDEATAEKDEAEEQSEGQLPANENGAPEGKTTDPAEEDADVDAENDGERKEEVAVETDCHPDETEQRRESGEEDESSVSEQPEQTDEAAVLDNAEAEAADATMEMKAESSEKQEALSCEEAPEAVTEGEADAEEGAEVTAESSSNQPQEDGDTTAHSTAGEGGGGEDEEHVSGAETGAEHSQQKNDELEEEKMVGGDEKTEKLKPEKDVEEEEKQTESEEVEEGVNTEEIEKSERKEVNNDESTVDQNTENSAEGSAKDTNAEAEVEVEGEETEEEEAATEEKEEEPEKTETNEGNDIDEKKKETGESEKDGDESDGGEDRSSANLAAFKKDNGAENSEKDGGEENTEECEEERYETERREETSQVIEEPELREESKVNEELVQISTERPADVPADEEETASLNHAENVQKEDEKGEIEAKDEEIEAPEAEESSSTSHEKDMKTEGQEEEEGETEEPAEGEDPEEAPEKMEDGVVRETCTVVIETSENKGDDSLKVYDEFTKIDSEASGGEPKEHPDESKACEEGDQSDADHQNTTSHLTEKENDIHDLTETQENPDAGDVGEAENWPDEEEQVLDDAVGDDAPADGADTEEVSKASEEGASVLLKPLSQHGEAGDTGRREAAEAPEVFAREDNTDLVTSWISVHQTSKFFQTFVEPLDDLTDAVVAPNSENKETASELQRSQSPGKLEAKSEDEENKEMFRDEPEFLEDGSAKTTQQVEEETEVKSSTSPTEPDDKQSPKKIKSEELQGRGAFSEEEEAGPSEGQHQEQIEIKSTSGSHHSASTSQPENQFSENATGPDAAAVQTTPEAPLEGEKNSQTEESWENAYSRQVTQITDFTTSVSVDGSREEPREEGEEIQRRGLEESFLIKDIQQTLHTEKLSPFSVDETLFAHTSYPLLTEL